MDKIVIFEPDDAARDRLEHLLVSAHLSDYCILTGRPDHAGITIWIGMEQDQPPGALNIRENDALRKPLRGGRLLDRIQHHIQEYSQKTHNSEQKIGNYQLKPAENTLKNEKTGEITYLTDKEKHILVFLLQKNGETVSRQALLDEVWGYAQSVETHTLETHMYRLRQKIEDDPANPAIIITKEQGYSIRP